MNTIILLNLPYKIKNSVITKIKNKSKIKNKEIIEAEEQLVRNKK